MLTYSFQDMGEDSLYEYLYKCIRRDILEGRIAAGEKLPSKRSFAKNLGVSIITVENAYAQLMAEGYIYSRPKSGYYASKINQYLLTPAEPDRPGVRHTLGAAESGQAVDGQFQKKTESRQTVDWQFQKKTENVQAVGWQARTETESGQKDLPPQKLNLVNSRTNPVQFPFTIWARLMREVLSEKREELMTNAPGAGVWKLRQAIGDYLLQYQGLQAAPEQIIIGAGTEYLYGLLIQLLGQDKVYALEDPGYVKMAKVYGSHLVRTAYIPMDGAGVQVERLRESGADVMHISPSHHYPTGITTPIGRRYELLGWANEKPGRYIIEDDYDCEFRLAGRPIPSLQSIDRQGRVIYMNTFTKSLASTIRIGYMVLPEQLLKRFREQLGFYSCTVSNFEQYTLAEFIGRGYFEKHINRMRNYYRGKRDELLREIENSPLGGKVRIYGADAGLHFLMQVETELTDEELIRRASAQGIQISCLSQYYQAPGQEKAEPEACRGRVVVNYSGLEQSWMAAMVRGLYAAWFN